MNITDQRLGRFPVILEDVILLAYGFADFVPVPSLASARNSGIQSQSLVSTHGSGSS